DDVHAEGLAVARHHRADLAEAVDAEGLAAEPGADGIGLPASGPQRGHLLRDAAQRRDDEPPRELGGGVRRPAWHLARGQDDAAPGAGVHVDVREDADLADAPQLVD